MIKHYFIISVLLFFSTNIFAQWEPLDGPYGGSIRDMNRNEKYVFASTNDGLFRSADGKTWMATRFVPGEHVSCGAIGVHDSIIVAAGSTGFFKSLNHGDTWEEISRPTGKLIYDIVLTEFAIYVSSWEELWYSTDLGDTWQLSSFPDFPSASGYISTNAQRVLVGSTGKIYVSSPTADEWISVPISYPNVRVLTVHVVDSLWFILDPYRKVLLRSSDGSLHWTENVDSRWDATYVQIGKVQDVYVISLDTLIVKSTDGGITWTNSESQGYVRARSLVTTDSSLLFGTFNRGVIRSDDFGDNCYSSTHGISASGVSHLATHEQSVLAASHYHGIFDFNQSNNEWGDQYDIALHDSYFDDMLSLNGNLYVSMDSKHVYRFNDATQSWDLILDSTFSFQGQFYTRGQMYSYQDTLMVSSNGLNMWHDDEQLWKPFDFYFEDDTIKPYTFAYNSNYLFSGNNQQVFRKSISSDTWIRILSTDTIEEVKYHHLKDVYSMGDKIFITMIVNYDSQDYRILMSEDQGLSWEFVDEDFPKLDFPWWSGLGQLQEINSHVLVHGYNYSLGVVVSALDHIQWQSFNEGLPHLGVEALAFDDEYIYAGLSSNGVWRRKISDLSITAVKPEISFNLFQCYPNPASSYFEVTSILPGIDNVNIYLTDITGRIMEVKKVLGYDLKIDVSGLPDGMYFVILGDSNRMYVQKLIIQH